MVRKRNGQAAPKVDPADRLDEGLPGLELTEFEAAPPEDDDEASAADHAVTTLVLIELDVSGSVKPYADVVTRSFADLVQKLRDDALTALGVRLAVVTTWQKLTPFAAVKDFVVPHLWFYSSSPLGRAASLGCEAVRAELKAAVKAGRPVNKMLMAVITDSKPKGESPQETREGVRQVRELREGRPPLNVFGFFVGPGEPGEFLRSLCGENPVVHAAEPDEGYRLIFNWLLGAIQSCSRSQPGEAAEMPPLPRGLVCR